MSEDPNPLSSNLQNLQAQLAAQAPFLQERVNKILEERSQDINAIDHLMDDLFPLFDYGYCVEDFHRLNAHLATVDPEVAKFYTEQFEEWMK